MYEFFKILNYGPTHECHVSHVVLGKKIKIGTTPLIAFSL